MDFQQRLRQFIWLASVALVTLTVGGCASKYAHPDLGTRAGLLEAFRMGNAVLDCETPCSGTWGAARNESKALHDSMQWQRLAELVLRIGYDVDLAWYFLGRAAEGLGYHAAAKKYYGNAINIARGNDSGRPCNGPLFNNCEGFVFPRNAEIRLAQLPKGIPVVTEASPDGASVPTPSLPTTGGEVASTGSGFFVGSNGYALTNLHVVEGCAQVTLRVPGRNSEAVIVAAESPQYDLALLRLNSRGRVGARLRSGASIRPGDAVIAVGFPLTGLLASQASVTLGSVSALAGISDDARFIQISAPIQPGNSGGPLLDMSGNVVGVIRSSLNAISVAGATGNIPQNVNFAIKGSLIREFLDKEGVHYDTATSDRDLKAADIGEIATSYTFLVECWQ